MKFAEDCTVSVEWLKQQAADALDRGRGCDFVPTAARFKGMADAFEEVASKLQAHGPDYDDVAYVVVLKRLHDDTPKLCKVIGELFHITPEEAGRMHASLDEGLMRNAYEVREVQIAWSEKGKEAWPNFEAVVEQGRKLPPTPLVMFPRGVLEELRDSLSSHMNSYHCNPQGSDYSCDFCGSLGRAPDDLISHDDCLGEKLEAAFKDYL